MRLTVKEMEVLCVFHAGSLSATLAAVRGAAEGGWQSDRMTDVKNLAEKLSRMREGDVVCLAFGPEQ